MQIHVNPEKLGFVAMRNTALMDVAISNQIREHHEIALEKMKNAVLIKPVITVHNTSRGETSDLILVVKFTILKNESPVWSFPQPDMYQPTVSFTPLVPFALAPHREKLAGLWEIRADVALIRESNLAAVPVANRFNFLLTRLSYQEVATFKWKVTGGPSAVLENLLPTGEVRHPEMETTTNVTLSAADI